ncbi:MAG: prolipoprotein diacylglyceryl transferase [Sandaracinaceae bacterium]|nr:prolipoprotein diacylglyceryl transferase [Sandaracinaceae bacterium]
MSILLFIPWFQAHEIRIPLPGGYHLPIQPFGVLVATGVLSGYRLAEWRAKKLGINQAVLGDLVAHVLFSGFICAHVLDAIFYHPEEVAANPLYLIQLWKGISSYGGFFGAIGGALLWRYRRKMSLLAVGDVIVFAFPLGWLFGRIGCFSVHDHPGTVTNFFLAVYPYEIGQPPFQARHDLGFYEVLFSLVVVPLFLWLGTKKTKPGLYMGLLPALYGPVRFGLDFLRIRPEEFGADADPRYLGLTPGHYGSVLLFAIGVAVIYYVYSRPDITLPPSALVPPQVSPKRTK